MSDDDELKIPGFHGWIFYILDADNQLVEVPDLMIWARWMFGDPGIDRRRVALDKVGDRHVSTIFLGPVSRNLVELGMAVRPFETLITGIGVQQTYATWAEAEAGHKEIVNRLRGIGEINGQRE